MSLHGGQIDPKIGAASAQWVSKYPNHQTISAQWARNVPYNPISVITGAQWDRSVPYHALSPTHSGPGSRRSCSGFAVHSGTETPLIVSITDATHSGTGSRDSWSGFAVHSGGSSDADHRDELVVNSLHVLWCHVQRHARSRGARQGHPAQQLGRPGRQRL